MNKRILWIASLGILLGPSILMSQPTAPSGTPSIGAPPKAEESSVTIFTAKYRSARELFNILQPLLGPTGTNIVLDDSGNRLIVRATEQRLAEVGALVKALDGKPVAVPPLLCRIYMLEIPPKEADFKPFVLVLQSLEGPLGSQHVGNAADENGLRIGQVVQTGGEAPGTKQQTLIKGWAASNEPINRMLASLPQSRIVEFKWEDDAFKTTVPAAQVSELPGPLALHLHKLLGAEVRTVGYWFGSFSCPGDVQAPLGSWMLKLKTGSGQASDLLLEVHVMQEPQYSMDRESTVLSNMVQAKIGKPIIIGYNREAYGGRTMGALVILLEPDTPLSGDAPTKVTPKP